MRSLLVIAVLAADALAGPITASLLGTNDNELITDISSSSTHNASTFDALELELRDLEARGNLDRPNERCTAFCADEVGGCAGIYARCFLSGTIANGINPIYTMPSNVGFMECSKECRRNPACEAVSWNGGECIMWPSSVDGMGFNPSFTVNQAIVWSNKACIDIKGQCLLHASSFEQPISPQGVAHPWNVYGPGGPPASLAFASNAESPGWKPAPTGTHFLKLSLLGRSSSATLEQIVRFDNQNYILSYNFLYHSFKVRSGNPGKPSYINVWVQYCGDIVDRFALTLYGPGNEGWKNRQARVTLPTCTNTYSVFKFLVFQTNDQPDGDYLLNLGFDDIQLIP